MTIQTDAFPELDRVKKFFPLGVENTQLLTKAQIDQYNDQGYLFPFDIFSAEEITEIRAYYLRQWPQDGTVTKSPTGTSTAEVCMIW